ncbi:MAG: carbamoyltransferase [Phycisphaerae bacterium]|nr:carbamoyltransferase [Phycisphaerae bacterium]
MFKEGKRINKHHNYDFSFLNKKISYEQKIDYFSDIERFRVVNKRLPHIKNVKNIDHHTCHAYYAAYGGELNKKELQNSVILTADAWGDSKNWSVSIVKENGKLKRLAAGNKFILARIYKFCTLILGMKPNEHEYKVMGLSGFSNSTKHIRPIENIFFNILDFKNGKFFSNKPLKDSYFDLKDRLEGFRFDNISSALQNWTSAVLLKWSEYWIQKTQKKGVAFSGGLSMNIKANGVLLESDKIKWLSVPPSGGDESLCIGACYYEELNSKKKNKRIYPMISPYLGERPVFYPDKWFLRLKDTNLKKSDFKFFKNFSNSKVAKLLHNDEIIARCVGRSEFGARALGNRSILANPRNYKNIELINKLIKNRDFWMPFTPSILSEHSKKLILNKKNISSPYMTIGFQSTKLARGNISASLHMGDYSARPQLVKKTLNPEYWDLINEFFKITKVPCLLNTSFNLHGEPMNYSVEDCFRTLALSSLDFLLLPDKLLVVKKKAIKKLENISL